MQQRDFFSKTCTNVNTVYNYLVMASATPENSSQPSIPTPKYRRSWEALRHLGLKSARLHALQQVYGIFVPQVPEQKPVEKTAAEKAAQQTVSGEKEKDDGVKPEKKEVEKKTEKEKTEKK